MTQRPFVCVVDDDPSILPALRRLLRAAEFEVEVFDSGATFATAFLKRRPDVVVLDVHMPSMDGFAVREQVHAVDATIPIVFITAHEGQRIDRRVEEDDMSSLLIKPFGADRLINAIVDAMTVSQLKQSIN